MPDFRDHYEKLKAGLEELRDLFVYSESAPQRLDRFDEYVREYEFDLALETLCDVLLEQGKPVDTLALQRIENLHNMMQVRDSCVQRLRALAHSK